MTSDGCDCVNGDGCNDCNDESDDVWDRSTGWLVLNTVSEDDVMEWGVDSDWAKSVLPSCMLLAEAKPEPKE